jgi:signal transduction histidine kinase/CheY-like chemotaxis protein/HPt (histidine-containing phosphotransfer) domain-containing protein
MSKSMPISNIGQLFTMTFAVNRELELSEVSAALTHRCPAAVDGAQLGNVFRLHRPQGAYTFDELLKNLDTLFLVISREEEMALRGQVVYLEDSDCLMFLGSPWLPWMTEHNPEVKLGLNEFPRHDPQMDAAFYEATQRAMVRDLEKVNEELRAAKENAEQAQRVQSDFFAVMSHEMRTPLNGVITSLSLIRDSQSEKEKNHLLKVAHTSAHNLMSVINYVLDYSKLEAGELVVEEEEFDLFETVHSIAEILSSKSINRGLFFDIDIASDVPRWVRGDGSKIRQMLINLASNAVKFTETGGVTIRVLANSGADRAVRITFQVIDTGVGIAPEHEDRIFDAFWTSSEKSPSGDANTGLGLNICSRIAGLLGGELLYNSTVGKGTTFEFSVDLTCIDEVVASDVDTDLATQFEGRVLLVDDNQTNLFVGGLMLERMGLDVRTANDGQEALEVLDNQKFDLVLMDITMPVMDGETATKTIRGKGNETPVIALTAHVGEELAAKYARSGMQGVVFKPINKAELIRTLSRYIPTKQIAAEARREPEIEDNSVLSASVIKTLISNIGEANFEAAKALFEKELETRVNALKSAWVQRDFAGVAIESHTLKSSSASFGAIELSEQMQLIETAARDQAVHDLVTLLPTVDSTVKRTRDAFQVYFEEA